MTHTVNRILVSRPVLGGIATICIEDGKRGETLGRLAEVAFGRMARVGALMGFHDRSSDVARLNACAHMHPLAVHQWTGEVLAQARQLAEQTAGLFEFVRAVGTPVGDPASYRDVEPVPTGRIFFQRKIEINLDAVARGFAVDKAVEYLATHDLYRASIELGGELRHLGASMESPRFLHLRDPRAGGTQFIALPMRDAAVATCAAFSSNRRHPLRRADAFVHPHTGRTLHSNISLSIFAPTCTTADALMRVVLHRPQFLWQPVLQPLAATAALLTGRGEVVYFPHPIAFAA